MLDKNIAEKETAISLAAQALRGEWCNTAGERAGGREHKVTFNLMKKLFN